MAMYRIISADSYFVESPMLWAERVEQQCCDIVRDLAARVSRIADS
jgi:hypothetical protein